MEIDWGLLERVLMRVRGQFTIEVFWYLTFASAMWIGFYWLLARWMKRRRIGRHPLDRRRVAWEVLYSFRSMLVFSAVAGLITIAVMRGWTRLYLDPALYGWGWIVASFFLLIFVHDAYFYWTHRAMHHPWLFRRVHRIHHLSTNPTPWAAYSFSIPEAIVQAAVVPLMIFLVPLHPFALLAFGVYRHFFSILGHSGHEVFPKWFLRSPLGWFFNTNTHHHQHHEVFNANYGLYFNFWDRLMGTNHARYEERFDEAVGAVKPASVAAPAVVSAAPLPAVSSSAASAS